MLLQNKQIALVGGGPGGLTLARLLQLKGANVKVYERDFNREVRVQGTMLDLHDESGLEALRKAELMEAFKKNFSPGADKMIIANEKAETFFSDHDTKVEENFGSAHFRPEIERGSLRNILLDSLQPDTVVWNSQFVSMEKQNDGWMLHFKNKASVYADIVIGADGARSKIRPFITSIKPFYSGITAIEGNVYHSETAAPTIHKLSKGGRLLAFGNSGFLGGGTKEDGSLTFLASSKIDESWLTTSGIDFADKAQVLSWFKKDFAEWSNVWYELFENATGPFIPRPIYCMPLDQTWESLSNLTMLGDAAHLMPPYAGEGVNMAMLDALELSENLTCEKFENIQSAISAYENEMRKRAAEAAQESLDNGDMMHSAGSLEKMLAFFEGVQS